MKPITEQDESPEANWPERVQEWFADHMLPDNPEHPAAAWEQHAASALPILTLFGAYDSGKSSLLRRLLVDGGATCPEWLTISARHETFDARLVELSGLRLRDTPGLSPEADDPRGEENNRLAFAAAGLTDALLVVLSPQLATSEFDALRKIVDQRWPPGSLRFAISRFDEAGVDPTGDRSQYEDLAARKVGELRKQLDLSQDVPVSVVVPDAFQLAGDLRQPDPSTWDSFRDWDGMRQFQEGLTSLSAQTPYLRAAAAVRYWAAALRTASTRLAEQQEPLRSALETTKQGRKRTEQLMMRLDELEAAARAELDGRLASVLDQALQAGLGDDARLRERTETALRDWFDKSRAELSRFAQEAETELARQMSRPAWRDLEDLLLGLFPESAEEPSAAPARDEAAPGEAGRLGPRLLELNTSFSKSLKDVKAVFAKRTRDYSASAKTRTPTATAGAPLTGAGRVLEAGEVLVAVGPVLVDVFNLISEWKHEREQNEAQERTLQEIEQKMTTLRHTVSQAAFAVLAEDVQSVRRPLKETADAVSGLTASISDRLALLELARDAAHDVLQAAPAGA